MKKYMQQIILVIPFLAFFACDEISKDDYIKEYDVPTSDQYVIIEDFTGTNCVNCPDAARTIDELTAQYGDHIIPIGIHVKKGRGQGESTLGSEDSLCSPAGREYVIKYNAAAGGLPVGMINRTLVNNSYLSNYTKWGEITSNVIMNTPPLKVELSNTLTDREVSITVDNTFLTDLTKPDDYYLVVLLTQDSILGRQSTLQGENPAYYHRHVLRASITDPFGELIYSGGISLNLNRKKTLTYVVPDEYNINYCELVAYVYRQSDGQILQGAHSKVVGSGAQHIRKK